MGYPIPPGPVVGDHCVLGDDVFWPAGKTPRFIHVELVYLIKCVLSPLEPPNAIWVLKQDAVDPCLWEYEDDKFFLTVGVDGVNTEIGCSGRGVAAGWSFFLGAAAYPSSDFNNLYVVCGGLRGARAGTAHIDWE